MGELLLLLTDELAEYEAINVFLCTAFTSVLSTAAPQSAELVQGAQYMQEFLQTRVWQLKCRLEAARERYRMETVAGRDNQ